ncbi:MAG: sodium:solute symporter family protein [Arenicella sp.]|nr:sodium:solute symporter family protein [Arenicella sp.]
MESSLFLTIFLIYVVFMIALGWFVSRKQTTGEDFLLGGRDMPIFLTIGTTVATMVGTGSSMGAVGFAYDNGWAGTLYGLGGAIGILLLAWLIAPVREHRFMTMSEELSYYVGANPLIKNVVAVLIFIASIGWLGAHMIGGGIYLAWVTDLSPSAAKVVVAMGFAVYVVIGGYTAVVWTDTIQAVILFVGFILMAVVSIEHVGGWSVLLEAQPLENVSLLGLDKVGLIPAMSLAAAILVGILATPSYRQRIYSAKSVSAARKSFILSGCLYLLFSFIPALIGMAAYAIDGNLKEATFAFPFSAIQVLPLWIGIVVLIAGLSATMSSASSDAIAAVSILLRDIFGLVTGKMPDKEKMIPFSRFGLILIIAVALVFALTSNDIIGYITKMISTIMSGLCVCSLLGKFWPRYNWQGALATLLGGSVTSILVISVNPWLEFWGNPILPAVLVALLVGVITAMITPASTILAEEALDILARERAQIE